MATFETKAWQDRSVEFAGRRTLTDVDSGEETVVDVARNEGEVSTTGDAFSAENMNGLETRINAAFNTVPESTTVTNIELVSTLPTDAASNTTTLYLLYD